MLIGASTSQDLSTYSSPPHEAEKGCPAIGQSECCPKTFLDPMSLQKNRDGRTLFQDVPIQRDQGWNDGSSAGETRVSGHLRTNSILCAGAPYSEIQNRRPLTEECMHDSGLPNFNSGVHSYSKYSLKFLGNCYLVKFVVIE